MFLQISRQVRVRKQWKAFGRGSIEWLPAQDQEGQVLDPILMYSRQYGNEKVIAIHNLSEESHSFRLETAGLEIFGLEAAGPGKGSTDLLGQEIHFDRENRMLKLGGLSYLWISVED